MKKCTQCKHYRQTSGGNGRSSGICLFFIEIKVPAWAEGKNFISEKRGLECKTFEQKKAKKLI